MAVAVKQIQHIHVSGAGVHPVDSGTIYHVDLSQGDLTLEFPPTPQLHETVFVNVIVIGGVLTLDGNGNDVNALAGSGVTIDYTPTRPFGQSVQIQFNGTTWEALPPALSFLNLVDSPNSYADRGFFVPMVSPDAKQLQWASQAELQEMYWYAFSTQGTPPPLVGTITGNHFDPRLVTEGYVSDASDSGNFVRDSLLAYSLGNLLQLHRLDAPENYALYRLTADPIAQADYIQFNMAYVAHGGIINDTDRIELSLRQAHSTFIESQDTPVTYIGNARRMLVVSDDEEYIRFEDPATVPRGQPYNYVVPEQMVDPGPGNVRLNHLDWLFVTQMAISGLDSEGNYDATLPFLGPGDEMIVWDVGTGSGAKWDVTQVTQQGTPGAYWYLVEISSMLPAGQTVTPPTDVRVLGAKGSAGVATSFLSLIDTPGSYTGHASKHVRVNSAGNALEFDALPTIPIPVFANAFYNSDSALQVPPSGSRELPLANFTKRSSNTAILNWENNRLVAKQAGYLSFAFSGKNNDGRRLQVHIGGSNLQETGTSQPANSFSSISAAQAINAHQNAYMRNPGTGSSYWYRCSLIASFIPT